RPLRTPTRHVLQAVAVTHHRAARAPSQPTKFIASQAGFGGTARPPRNIFREYRFPHLLACPTSNEASRTQLASIHGSFHHDVTDPISVFSNRTRTRIEFLDTRRSDNGRWWTLV
ncbi:unnamed protein product, partial [Pleuronectes platessa]